MSDFSHLDAIQARLCRETARLNQARNANERTFRTLCVNQTKKELANELKFLGLPETPEGPEMTAAELLAALGVA